MRISLVTPSRGRPERFAAMIASAFTHAMQPDRVRVDALVDADDQSLDAYLALRSNGVHVAVGAASPPVPKAFDDRARQALHDGADVLMLCSDDVVFRTDGWDEKIAAHISRFDDRLVLVAPNDACNNGKANFWFVTRQFMEAVGYFCWREFEHFCCDTMTELIARRAERFVYADDVLCEHMHPKYGRAENDALYRSKRLRAADGTNMSDRDISRMNALGPEIDAAARRVSAAVRLASLARENDTLKQALMLSVEAAAQ